MNRTGLFLFFCNQQYSITAITDGIAAVVERYAYTAYGTPTITDASGATRTTTAIGNRYTYTGREWDETLALYHFRARMYDSVAGRFVSRDPIGYEDGMALFAAYFVVMDGFDPTGTKGNGHHIIPWSLFNGKVSKAVSKIFDGDDARLLDECWPDHNYGPAGGVKHSDYNKAVEEELKKFLAGKDLSEMTEAEARAFLQKIKTSPAGSVIGKFNNGIKQLIREARDRVIKEASEKAARKGIFKCCKKGVGFCVRKFPVCALAIFCYDSYDGGVGHACNELTWPVSELWNE